MVELARLAHLVDGGRPPAAPDRVQRTAHLPRPASVGTRNWSGQGWHMTEYRHRGSLELQFCVWHASPSFLLFEEDEKGYSGGKVTHKLHRIGTTKRNQNPTVNTIHPADYKLESRLSRLRADLIPKTDQEKTPLHDPGGAPAVCVLQRRNYCTARLIGTISSASSPRGGRST